MPVEHLFREFRAFIFHDLGVLFDSPVERHAHFPGPCKHLWILYRDFVHQGIRAARRVASQLGVHADFVVADGRFLPFPDGTFQHVYSYSVLQHLERSAVMRFFREVSRVLKPKGVCLVQLPNVFGLHNMLQQAKRGFREGRSGTFEMRYWSTKAIRQAVEMAGLKDMAIRPEGFFTQNPQLSDLDLLSPKGKMIVLVSNAGRKLAAMFPIVTGLADSFWVEARVR